MFQRLSTLAVVVTACASFLMANPAQAGLLLEPYMGIEQGQTYNVGAAYGDASYKTSGAVVGARVAYSLPLLFWIGLDYSLMAGGKAKPDLGGSDSDMTRSDLYAVVGADLPILLRVWGGFGVMNTATAKTAGGDSTVKGGTKMKVGAGLTMFPFISLNLELFNNKGPKLESGGTTLDASTFEDAGGVLSVSLPLDL